MPNLDLAEICVGIVRQGKVLTLDDAGLIADQVGRRISDQVRAAGC